MKTSHIPSILAIFSLIAGTATAAWFSCGESGMNGYTQCAQGVNGFVDGPWVTKTAHSNLPFECQERVLNKYYCVQADLVVIGAKFTINKFDNMTCTEGENDPPSPCINP